MTQLKAKVTRSLAGLLRRNLIVTLYPGGVLGFRESRSRKEYTLPVVTCYRLAVEAEFRGRKGARK